MHPLPSRLAFAAVLLLPIAHAEAQATRPRAAAIPTSPTSVPATTTSPATPQQTTATFEDWTLRCTRASPAAPACEIVQGVNSQDRTVAQSAIGRPAKDQPLQLTILVPPSVGFARPAALATTHDNDPPVTELACRRCLPGGCMADAKLSDDVVRRIRAWTDPARVIYTDAAGRTVALPFSPRGLKQALDALAKGETE